MKGKENIKSFQVRETAELFPFLMSAMPGKSRDNIKSLLRNELVLVDGQTQRHVKFALQVGQTVTVGKKAIKVTTIPGVKIIHEDEHIVVVEKPAGLLTVSTEKENRKTLFRYLSAYVKQQNENNRIFVVHRLDRETSGILVFARSEKVKNKLQQRWNENVEERIYVAQVEGRVADQERTIMSYLRESKALKVHSSANPTYGQQAITHLKTIEVRKNSSIVQLELETGRKNQIRVHLQEIGHPVVGDTKYGSKIKMQGRIALHARTLAFNHPVTGEPLRFESKVPREVMA